jgi:hypothetical protein
MKMPGFTAESSLYGCEDLYGTNGLNGSVVVAVYPAKSCNYDCISDCANGCPSCGELPPNLVRHAVPLSELVRSNAVTSAVDDQELVR